MLYNFYFIEVSGGVGGIVNITASANNEISFEKSKEQKDEKTLTWTNTTEKAIKEEETVRVPPKSCARFFGIYSSIKDLTLPFTYDLTTSFRRKGSYDLLDSRKVELMAKYIYIDENYKISEGVAKFPTSGTIVGTFGLNTKVETHECPLINCY